MHQAKVMQLLEEASKLGVEARNERDRPRWDIPNNHPVTKIHRKLRAACTEPDNGEGQRLMKEVLDILYADTVIFHPENLPRLFPFFSLACADRPATTRWALIDWFQMGQPHH